MSADALRTWHTIAMNHWQRIDAARLGRPVDDRPSLADVAQVGLTIAIGTNKSKSHCDLTVEQIRQWGLGSLSASTVKNCLDVLLAAGVLQTLTRGGPGRGTQRRLVDPDTCQGETGTGQPAPVDAETRAGQQPHTGRSAGELGQVSLPTPKDDLRTTPALTAQGDVRPKDDDPFPRIDPRPDGRVERSTADHADPTREEPAAPKLCELPPGTEERHSKLTLAVKTRLQDRKQPRHSDHVARIAAHCLKHYAHVDDPTLIDFAQGIAVDCPYQYGTALDQVVQERGTARGLCASQPNTAPTAHTEQETPQ